MKVLSRMRFVLVCAGLTRFVLSHANLFGFVPFCQGSNCGDLVKWDLFGYNPDTAREALFFSPSRSRPRTYPVDQRTPMRLGRGAYLTPMAQPNVPPGSKAGAFGAQVQRHIRKVIIRWRLESAFFNVIEGGRHPNFDRGGRGSAASACTSPKKK